tara:strand:+ start:237 stop:365 length:129 start_codon:yes stop_codon:yes gene_type:complete
MADIDEVDIVGLLQGVWIDAYRIADATLEENAMSRESVSGNR